MSSTANRQAENTPLNPAPYRLNKCHNIYANATIFWALQLLTCSSFLQESPPDESTTALSRSLPLCSCLYNRKLEANRSFLYFWFLPLWHVRVAVYLSITYHHLIPFNFSDGLSSGIYKASGYILGMHILFRQNIQNKSYFFYTSNRQITLINAHHQNRVRLWLGKEGKGLRWIATIPIFGHEYKREDTDYFLPA